MDVLKIDENKEHDDIKGQPIEVLDLSVRTYSNLKRAGYNVVGDIIENGLEKLWKSRNLGKRSIKEIEDVFHQFKLPFFPDDYTEYGIVLRTIGQYNFDATAIKNIKIVETRDIPENIFGLKEVDVTFTVLNKLYRMNATLVGEKEDSVRFEYTTELVDEFYFVLQYKEGWYAGTYVFQNGLYPYGAGANGRDPKIFKSYNAAEKHLKSLSKYIYLKDYDFEIELIFRKDLLKEFPDVFNKKVKRDDFWFIKEHLSLDLEVGMYVEMHDIDGEVYYGFLIKADGQDVVINNGKENLRLRANWQTVYYDDSVHKNIIYDLRK